MLKKLTLSLAIGAAATLSCAGFASARDLVYGAGIPAKSEEITLGAQVYANLVNKLSGGKLTIKVLAGGQVVSLQNTLANLRDGTIDVGFVVPAFTQKELANTNVLYDTEIYGTDPAAITGAINETLLFDCKDCVEEFHKNGAVYIASFGNNDKGLICRKPIKTLADVKGLKIRAIGAATRLIAAMGAVPVAMSPTDATTALERGTVDCVHGVATWMKNFGYWDVVKYMLESPLGSPRTISSVVYSRRTWEKMTPEEKKAAIAAVPEHLAGMVYDVNVDAEDRLKEIAKKDHHVTFTEGGKDFKEFLANFQKAQMTEIPALAKKRGVANADKIFAAFMKNLDKWEKLAKEKDLKHNKKLMTEIFKKEIYDKLDPAKL